jgi:hypothetical protein
VGILLRLRWRRYQCRRLRFAVKAATSFERVNRITTHPNSSCFVHSRAKFKPSYQGSLQDCISNHAHFKLRTGDLRSSYCFSEAGNSHEEMLAKGSASLFVAIICRFPSVMVSHLSGLGTFTHLEGKLQASEAQSLERDPMPTMSGIVV